MQTEWRVGERVVEGRGGGVAVQLSVNEAETTQAAAVAAAEEDEAKKWTKRAYYLHGEAYAHLCINVCVYVCM